MSPLPKRRLFVFQASSVIDTIFLIRPFLFMSSSIAHITCRRLTSQCILLTDLDVDLAILIIIGHIFAILLTAIRVVQHVVRGVSFKLDDMLVISSTLSDIVILVHRFFIGELVFVFFVSDLFDYM